MASVITGFGIFAGLVAGVVVQVAANWVQARWQKNNAKNVFSCEVELNLSEVEVLKQRMRYIRDRVTAGQASEFDLSINMLDFDYSALSPLVHSGYFHKLLGTQGVKKYLAASKFFNNQTALYLSNRLLNEHNQGTSVNYLDWLDREINLREIDLRAVQRIVGGSESVEANK